jgi:hypothetical protein
LSTSLQLFPWLKKWTDKKGEKKRTRKKERKKEGRKEGRKEENKPLTFENIENISSWYLWSRNQMEGSFSDSSKGTTDGAKQMKNEEERENRTTTQKDRQIRTCISVGDVDFAALADFAQQDADHSLVVFALEASVVIHNRKQDNRVHNSLKNRKEREGREQEMRRRMEKKRERM